VSAPASHVSVIRKLTKMHVPLALVELLNEELASLKDAVL